MTFTAEINIASQDGFDMTLGCPSPWIPSIKQHLKNEGFTISSERISIPGTQRISDWVELEIKGSEFDELRDVTIKFLKSENVKYTEERFNSIGDLHSRFNLENISVFDKTS